MEGGEESQQATRGRNRGTCLELIWTDQEADTEKEEGAEEEHCSASEAQIETLWDAGEGRLRDHLGLQT